MRGLTVWNSEVAASDRDWMNSRIWSHNRDYQAPVWLGGGGDKQSIERSRHLEFFFAFGRNKLVRSEL